ncbi:MAG: hypothetical protein ACKOE6_06315, partial [Flammeovirgaceae bacterium]
TVVKQVVDNFVNYSKGTLELCKQYTTAAGSLLRGIANKPTSIQAAVSELIEKAEPLTPQSNALRKINVLITASTIPNQEIAHESRSQLVEAVGELIGADEHTVRKLKFFTSDKDGRTVNMEELMPILNKLAEQKEYFGEQVSPESKREWEQVHKHLQGNPGSFTQDPKVFVIGQNEGEKVTVDKSLER